jgi:PIN domain nuclease of toxin-antitoxin system
MPTRVLLDTHTFIWWNNEPERLSERVHSLISDEGVEVFFSAVSAWEISVKYGKGRLQLPVPPVEFVLTRVYREGFQALPIDINHAVNVGRLPPIHNDPFDRLLVAQSQLQGFPILTSDANIARYDVEVIW